MQKMRFSRSTMIHNDSFLMQTFFNFWQISKRFIQCLTSCIGFSQNLTFVHFLTSNLAFRKSTKNAKYVVSRSNTFQNAFCECYFFKLWNVLNVFFQTMTRFIFLFQSFTHSKIRNLRSCFSKKHEKSKTCRFYDVKETQNGIFWMLFFQLLNFFRFFSSKFETL